MAARTRKGTKDNPWPEIVRQRIRASMLANELQKHVLGKREMSNTQVTAALGLLRKVVPDMTHSTGETEVTHHYVARLPQRIENDDAWQQQLTPSTIQ